MRFKFAVLLVVLFGSVNAFGDVDFQNMSQEGIKDELYEKARFNHHSLGYSSARKNLLGNLALDQVNNSYVIHEVYCEKDYSSPGPGRVPNNTVINVEHTWPQSKFGGRDRGMQKSDLHHLFPTDSKLNSIRGNNPFGNVIHERESLKCQKSKFGTNDAGQTVFEPPTNHKGNVARALFYFSVRYSLRIDPVQEAALREWHELDPVDEEELIRNEEIEDMQGNINPFIENPEYVDLINDF